MTLTELCQEVLELDKKATTELHNAKFHARYRTSAVNLALAAQRMEKALDEIGQQKLYPGIAESLRDEAQAARADVQKMLEEK